MPEYKNYVFTYHNYDADTMQRIVDNFGANYPMHVKYIIFQQEQAPTTGNLHLQGYIELTKRKSMKWLKDVIFQTKAVHILVRRGSQDQARSYCSKQETRVEGTNFIELGKFTPETSETHETVTETLVRMVKEGKTDREIAESHPAAYMRHNKQIAALRTAIRKIDPTYNEKDVLVFVGETGTGKTREAYKIDPYLYRMDITERWHDGYTDEETILLDDFPVRPPQDITYYLRYLDGYPMQVPIKGGFVQLRNKRVIITSNHHPDEWFPSASDAHKKALMRRIKTIRTFQSIDRYIGETSDAIFQSVPGNYQMMENNFADIFMPHTMPAAAGAGATDDTLSQEIDNWLRQASDPFP